MDVAGCGVLVRGLDAAGTERGKTRERTNLRAAAFPPLPPAEPAAPNGSGPVHRRSGIAARAEAFVPWVRRRLAEELRTSAERRRNSIRLHVLLL